MLSLGMTHRRSLRTLCQALRFPVEELTVQGGELQLHVGSECNP